MLKHHIFVVFVGRFFSQLPTTKVAGLQLPDVVPTSSGDSPPIVPSNTSVLEKGVASRSIPEAKRSGIAGALTGAQRYGFKSCVTDVHCGDIVCRTAESASTSVTDVDIFDNADTRRYHGRGDSLC